MCKSNQATKINHSVERAATTTPIQISSTFWLSTKRRSKVQISGTTIRDNTSGKTKKVPGKTPTVWPKAGRLRGESFLFSGVCWGGRASTRRHFALVFCTLDCPFPSRLSASLSKEISPSSHERCPFSRLAVAYLVCKQRVGTFRKHSATYATLELAI